MIIVMSPSVLLKSIRHDMYSTVNFTHTINVFMNEKSLENSEPGLSILGLHTEIHILGKTMYKRSKMYSQ